MPPRAYDRKLPPSMARHLRDLDCDGMRDYVALCRRHGFPPSLDKSRDERERERETVEAATTAREEHLRAMRRLQSSPHRIIETVCCDALPPGAQLPPEQRHVAACIQASVPRRRDRRDLAQFLRRLEDVSDLVFGALRAHGRATRAIGPVLLLFEQRGRWRRDPTAWRPDSHNTARQFSSLLQHLFAAFAPPRFLERAWLRDDSNTALYREWYIQLGAGQSMRRLQTPYPMTRKTAHFFTSAPHDLTVEAALIWADVATFGGDRRLVERLAATSLGRVVVKDPEQRAFWLSVYRFFHDNPLLDPQHYGPIVDYLRHQKFESQQVFLPGGEVEARPPEQPHLTMRGRSAETLLRQVEEWHAALTYRGRASRRAWRSCRLPGLCFSTGAADRPETQAVWRVTEILTLRALSEEGSRMRHCVSTYAESCARGRVAIWSVTRQGALEGGPARVLTVSTMRDRVTEVRGRANRLPTRAEWEIVKHWMREASLSPAPYLAGWGGQSL